MKTYHVKKGDEVIVNSGNFRGERAKIIAVLTKKDRVVLEIAGKSEVKLGKRTVKKSKANPNQHGTKAKQQDYEGSRDFFDDD